MMKSYSYSQILYRAVVVVANNIHNNYFNQERRKREKEIDTYLRNCRQLEKDRTIPLAATMQCKGIL